MSIYDKIMETYPDIASSEFVNGNIELRDDGDGNVYLHKWDLDLALPDGLSIGK